MKMAAFLTGDAAPVGESAFVRAAVARMQGAPRFVSAAEAASYATYEANGGPVVSGDPQGWVPDNLANDGNE
jgi:hypothetical protein